MLGDWNGVAGVQWGGGEKGGKGKKRKREKEGGIFRVPGELVFRPREEAEARLQEGVGDSNGHDGNYEGGGSDDKGEEGDKGVTSRAKTGVRWGMTRGVGRKGTQVVRRGVPGARMRPDNPPPRMRGLQLAKEGLGGWGTNMSNRASRTNQPAGDPVPVRQMTFRVTYGVGG